MHDLRLLDQDVPSFNIVCHYICIIYNYLMSCTLKERERDRLMSLSNNKLQ